MDDRIKEQLQRSADAFEPAEGVSLPIVLHRARVLRARALVAVVVAALFIGSGALVATRIGPSTKKGSFIQPNRTASVDANY
ncbi:MAG TPA: hypothetical protein VKV69_03010, partial [Actinomycetota bacterium]|nr:hypothetical protein [Actinomycetota bacterium]